MLRDVPDKEDIQHPHINTEGLPYWAIHMSISRKASLECSYSPQGNILALDYNPVKVGINAQKGNP